VPENSNVKTSVFLAGLVFALGARPAQAAYNWGNVAIGAGGFVAGIESSPAQNGLFYARTDVGGAYRWNSATDSWVAITDMFPLSQGNYLGIESIAPDPTNANVVYAAGGMYEGSGNGVILSSTNQGASWTINTIGVVMGGNDMGRGIGERLTVDPNLPSTLYFGTRNAGLYKSTNSAATWAKVASFPTNGGNFTFSWNVPSGLGIVIVDGQGGTAGTASNTLFVAAADTQANSNLYRSNDAGATWTLVAGGPSGFMAHHAGLASDGTLWLAYSNDMGPYDFSGVALQGQVWKYKVSTGAWTNVTPPNTNWGGMAGGLSVDAQNPSHVAVSTLDWYTPDRILATADGGTTWNVIAQPAVSYWSTGVSTYNDNGVLYWYPGGATTIGTGPTNWVEALAIDPFNSSHAFHGCGAGIWESTNIQSGGTQGSGVVWNFNDAGLEETVPQFMMPSVGAGSAFLGVVGDLGGMRNTSLTSYSASGEYSNPTCNNNNGIDFAESGPNFVVRVGNSGVAASDVSYSNDNGVTWAPCTGALPGYGGPNQMASVAVGADGKTIVASPYSGKGSPAWSTNNGASWTTCTGLPSGALVAADRVTASLFYGTSAGTLYVSTNSGQSFSSAGTFTYNGAPRPVFGQAGEVWVADNNGGSLWRFTGVGTTNTKTQVAGVSAVYGVGFGKAAAGYTHPAVFIIGTVGGQYGFWRCDDGVGATAAAWTRINDNAHQYGWLQGCYIGGDENVFGRCYLTTAGRGYVYGDLVAGTPTPTASVTPSRTASPSPSPSATRTASPSATRTVTVSPSGSPTATGSPTPSMTPSGSATPAAGSPTGTVSPSRTASPSATATATPSVTHSPSATPTSSPVAATGTPTPTLSPSVSGTASPTASPSALVSATATVTDVPPGSTATASPSASPTLTEPFTASPSVTVSVTRSVTPNATPSPTATASGSLTASLTASPMASATASFTAGASPTPSVTASLAADSPTLTATATASPASTATVTAQPSASATLTTSGSPTVASSATPTSTILSPSPTPTALAGLSQTATPTVTGGTPGSGVLSILDMKPVPNPGAKAMAVKLSSACDALTLKVWSVNLVLVAEVQAGPCRAGWTTVPLPVESLPSGLYFATGSAIQGSRRSPPYRPVRLFLWR